MPNENWDFAEAGQWRDYNLDSGTNWYRSSEKVSGSSYEFVGRNEYSYRDAQGQPAGSLPSGSVRAHSSGGAPTRVNSSYPPIFSASPGESYSDWKRSVAFWLAGEGKTLPEDMIGPRMMIQLRLRAGKIVKRLDSEDVSVIGGKELVYKCLEKSPLIRQLDKHRVDQHRKKLTSLQRFPNESIASYITRGSLCRLELTGEDKAMEMGDAFYVGHLMDNAMLTKRDRALIRAKAFSDCEEDITDAMVELAGDLEGVQGFPIGAAEPDMPGQRDDRLFQRPSASASAPAGAEGSATPARRFGFQPRSALRAELGAEYATEGQLALECGGESLDEADADLPPEVLHAEHEALAMEHRAKHKVLEVKKMRQYFSGGDGRDNPEKQKWLAEKQKSEPCFNCKQLGRWSRECPQPKKPHGTLLTYKNGDQQEDTADDAWATLCSMYQRQFEINADESQYMNSRADESQLTSLSLETEFICPPCEPDINHGNSSELS